MTQGWAETIVYLAVAYAAIGAIFGVLFIARGLNRIDPSATGSGFAFRLLIFPGVIALWPVLLNRWRRARQGPPVEVTAHRRAAR